MIQISVSFLLTMVQEQPFLAAYLSIICPTNLKSASKCVLSGSTPDTSDEPWVMKY